MANTKVTGDVIANGTISTVHLADDAITAAKLDSTATGITFADLTVSGNSTLTGNLTVNGVFTSQGIDDNADATAITINGNEEVGIGTTSPFAKLHVETTANTTARFAYNSSNYQDLNWEGSNIVGGSHVFKVGGTERMRIDSSGNLLITKQAANNATVGNQFMTDGSANSTVNGDTVARFNRLTSDGEIIRLQKDTSTVGSIGSTTSYLNSSLGIGETSPTSKLHVKDIPAATSGAILTLRNSQATASNTTFGGIFFNSAPGYDFSIGKSNVNSTTTLSFRNGNSGASLMDIDASGNVGIGTTSPSQKLHVVGKALITDDIQLTGSNPRIDFNSNGSSSLRFYDTTNAAERMRIDSSGNVGINDTGPSFILDANITGSRARFKANTGDANIELSSIAGRDWLISSLTDGSLRFYDEDAASERMRINSVGDMIIKDYGNIYASTNNSTVNSGIYFGGTDNTLRFYTSNDEKMRITSGGYTEIKATGGSSRLYLEGTNGTHFLTGTSGGDFGIYNDTASSYRMFINSSGNVGIGTTSPSQKLDVAGNIYATGRTQSANTLIGSQTISSTDFATLGSNSSGVGIAIARDYAPSSYPDIIINSSGNVGIGTASPDQKLTVNGNIKIGAGYYFFGGNPGNPGDTTAALYDGSGVGPTLSGLNVAFRAGTPTPAEVMRIASNGNVGIGTTSPDGALHVVGKINTTRIISSNLILGNIRSNLTTTTYLLLVDLNVSGGFSLVGELNAASYTTYNVSRIYVRKNYNATTGVAVITGIAKSGSNLSVVDISHSSGRFIAIKLTGDPEIDVMWTGYRLNDQFNSDGTIKILTSGVTENSVYASY